MNYKVINAGLSGETSAGGLRRVDWLLKQKVDILVLELGGNDGLRGISTETMQSNLQAIIDRAKAKYPNIKIVIAGMQAPPNLGTEYLSAFKAVFPELAKKIVRRSFHFFWKASAAIQSLTCLMAFIPPPKVIKLLPKLSGKPWSQS